MKNSEGKPPIRIIHHLARTGGTLICKCLATMDKTVLLSEIHPYGMTQFHPLAQLINWYDVLRPSDIEILKPGVKISFLDSIKLVEMRCKEKGVVPVIRDWTHLDYTPSPFKEKPDYQLTIQAALRDHFGILSFSTVRHPIDQFLSLARLTVMQQHLNIDQYLFGYLEFAKRAKETGFVRYEDFTRQPDETLKIICEKLKLTFDPGYKDKWHIYKNITGDVDGTRATSEIVPLKRREYEPELLKMFQQSPYYQESLDLMGYE